MALTQKAKYAFANIIDDMNYNAYAAAYSEACGNPDASPPVPARDNFRGHDVVWGWTTKQDEAGHYWSFRLRPGLVVMVDYFESHRQRQAGKSRARTRAKRETELRKSL